MNTTTIELSGSAGISQISELYNNVMEAHLAGQAIAFDLRQTRAIDASILQLLLATQATAEQGGLQMEFLGASDSLAEMLEQ